VPISNKEADTVAYYFRRHVLGVYGAPVVVVTDQGNVFRKEFHDLCLHSFIDHRTTSAYHPQAYGLSERSVQTIKLALAKMAGVKTDSRDDLLPFSNNHSPTRPSYRLGQPRHCPAS
jgi:transposase InsO family protein